VNDQMAKGLGYFSLALGMAELVAPRAICRAAGLEGHEGLVRAYGAREIAAGLAILGSHDATPWVWGRVAGDAADIATVAAGANNLKSAKTSVSLAVLAAATALDVFCATRLAGEKGRRTTAHADYHDRSGFPRGVEAIRGAARARDKRSSDGKGSWTHRQSRENTAADAE
jgi:hypothetical protein